MMARRPFGSDARLLFAARIEWFGLTEADWLEAFSQHPHIGDRAALAARFPATHDLSSKNRRVWRRSRRRADRARRRQRGLFRALRIHLHRVCDGEDRGGDVGSCVERLPNDRATELRIAAEEQAKITALRLS